MQAVWVRQPFTHTALGTGNLLLHVGAVEDNWRSLLWTSLSPAEHSLFEEEHRHEQV